MGERGFCTMGTTPICDMDSLVKMMCIMPEINVTKREVAFTCVFKNGILYSNRCGRPRKERISNLFDSTVVQCFRDLITGIVNLELKTGLKVLQVRLDILWTITCISCSLSLLGLRKTFLTFILFRNWRKKQKREIVEIYDPGTIQKSTVWIGGLSM
ncbi:hypothetical protein TNIN_91301 [Trichonephila inaurata madagascariensis]|uniref:Uncharacterized protein n=1 Tax=Trichonephila inaurata madagascariensis TaxID=2747483 RepID=A0A8X7CDE6_9ARAC|nr:hypothetical protein TNIN_91301 [Trichonephila inaurata madagascariensis]